MITPRDPQQPSNPGEVSQCAMSRHHVSALVDLRTLIHSRAKASTNRHQVAIYAMAAAAIELGLLEVGIALDDRAGGGTTWVEATGPVPPITAPGSGKDTYPPGAGSSPALPGKDQA